jgi:hypothetical protein
LAHSLRPWDVCWAGRASESGPSASGLEVALTADQGRHHLPHLSHETPSMSPTATDSSASVIAALSAARPAGPSWQGAAAPRPSRRAAVRAASPFAFTLSLHRPAEMESNLQAPPRSWIPRPTRPSQRRPQGRPGRSSSVVAQLARRCAQLVEDRLLFLRPLARMQRAAIVSVTACRWLTTVSPIIETYR